MCKATYKDIIKLFRIKVLHMLIFSLTELCNNAVRTSSQQFRPCRKPARSIEICSSITNFILLQIIHSKCVYATHNKAIGL